MLDDKILKETFELNKVKAKKELINMAPEEFVNNRKILNLMDLKGKIEFIEDYDHKKMREGK